LTNARGLAALILTFIFSTTLAAEYLYKDEVVFIESFESEIEKIGAEVREKTGVGMYVAVIKELDDNQTLADFENAILDKVQEPALVLTLSEYDQQIDIMARPASLYKDFDKEQILSPFPNSGTILPILTMKAKKATVSEKFAAAVQNGYTDLAEQIAESKGVVLQTAVGSSNKTIINILRLIFYGMIAYGLYMYIKRKYFTKKRGDE
jgi:hypothetical protein